jgi:DNA-binding transcriptional MerR regulator
MTGLSIAEVSAVTGLSADTLRYYEKDGLMVHPVARDTSGHRSYSEADLGWLSMLNCLRATGMPIRDVRRYADLVRLGDGTEGARLELLRSHRESVLTQLEDAQRHLEKITNKVATYEDKLAAREEAYAQSA